MTQAPPMIRLPIVHPGLTEQERRLLVAQLWATRAAVDAALTLLGEGADVPASGGADDDEDDECMHPPELRVDESEFGGPLEWRCRGCGFFHSATDSN